MANYSKRTERKNFFTVFQWLTIWKQKKDHEIWEQFKASRKEDKRRKAVKFQEESRKKKSGEYNSNVKQYDVNKKPEYKKNEGTPSP